jgi:hypothetical protein
VLAVGLCLWLRLWISGLDVSARHTSLRMGETLQLVVARKDVAGHRAIGSPRADQVRHNLGNHDPSRFRWQSERCGDLG